MEEEKYNKPTPIPDLNLLHIKTIGAGPVSRTLSIMPRFFSPHPLFANPFQEHTLAVSTNSEVYCTGASTNGKLGHKVAEMDEMDDAFSGNSQHRSVAPPFA